MAQTLPDSNPFSQAHCLCGGRALVLDSCWRTSKGWESLWGDLRRVGLPLQFLVAGPQKEASAPGKGP